MTMDSEGGGISIANSRIAHGLTRRSFLARVTGGGVLVIGAGALVTGCAPRKQASGLTDCDAGPNADEAGNGRTGGNTGITDSDSGPNADFSGCGRGGEGASITDNDRGRLADRAGEGRGTANRYSDSDMGLNADPIGRGAPANEGEGE